MSNIKLIANTLTLSSILLLSGCASTDYANLPVYRNIGVKHPSPLNGFTGGVFIEPFSNDYIELMQMRCSSYGGLDFSSQTTIHKNAIGEKVIQYKCNAANAKQSEAQPQLLSTPKPNVNTDRALPTIAPSTTSSFSFEDSKNKCVELGFKSGTEGFGKCVLQLSK
jgi:hypothetical protein